MTKLQTITLAVILVGVAFAAAAMGALIAIDHATAPTHSIVGSASVNTFDAGTTGSSVWILTTDTTLVATNTSRQFLEISNQSGATGTAQTLYCNTNGAAAALYSGIAIYASSSAYRFSLDGALYKGALHCKFPAAAGTIGIVER